MSIATPQNTQRLNINLTQESFEELKRLADEAGVSMTEYVRNSIRVYSRLREEKKNKNQVFIGHKDSIDKELLIP